jgi:hypothetical protein
VDERRQIYEQMRERSLRDKVVPVIHLAGAWVFATSYILEHDRDGAEVRIADSDVWGFPGGHTADGASRVRHFWFAEDRLPIPSSLGPCLHVFTRTAAVTVFESETPDGSCSE